ncbi:MAG TPA: glycosyltransferase [Kribbellaceae bacterium]|nr:glycosyltransferase [Kribbellaceae bacterium]
MSDRVTTVVITRDRKAALLETLTRHSGSVVVVDNGSTDGTAEALATASMPHVRTVRLDRNHGAPARNLGVALSTTPYVAFADDDSWWEPGMLRRAVAILDRWPRIGLLAARILLDDGGREDPVCALMADSPLPARPDLPGRPVLGFVACASVVRREAFLLAGGFDHVVFFAGEEARLSIDLAAGGWDQCYVPELVARHEPSPRRSADRVRQRLISRNIVLTAVMRRSWPTVLRLALEQCRRGPGAWRGVVSAVPRLPMAMVNRKRVGPDLEARLRLID